jgi:hypothetical protein
MRHLVLDALAPLSHLAPLLGGAATLDPGRTRAPSPEVLAARVVEAGGGGTEAGRLEAGRLEAFAEGLAEVVSALAAAFPENVFWDLDHLACCLWHAGGPAQVRALGRRLARLCTGFGLHSPLRFRYAHDLLYGYDWARWVAREPETREAVGPFDAPFLDYLEERREALVQLIARDDAKYGRLRGPGFRNPFTFKREPHEEAQLHRALARADLIPVKAWRLDGERRWCLPFSELRAQTAQRLGLERPDAR